MWRGQKDKAFEWLGSRAYRQRDGGLTAMKLTIRLFGWLPRFDPRYVAMLRKLNLPRDANGEPPGG